METVCSIGIWFWWGVGRHVGGHRILWKEGTNILMIRMDIARKVEDKDKGTECKQKRAYVSFFQGKTG